MSAPRLVIIAVIIMITTLILIEHLLSATTLPNALHVLASTYSQISETQNPGSLPS